MILRNARVALAPAHAAQADIEARAGRFQTIGRVPGRIGLDLAGYIVLPGLINAHDHLEFNLFPRLGSGIYLSCAEWARDIHRTRADVINEIRAVPKTHRLIWGGLKNLVSGVTTVCHHNPWEKIFSQRFPVRVLRNFAWAHSLEFSPDLAVKFTACPPSKPFIFHAGEAVDGPGRGEMAALRTLGVLAPNAVLVHAVALNGESLKLAGRNSCAIVWCPSSNLFMLGQTLSAEVLRDSGLPIALGTDSAVTAEGDMFDELRVARLVSGLPQERLYRMVTDIAARILRLHNGAGTITPGGVADFVVFPDCGDTPAEVIFGSRPEAVFIGGRLQLASSAFAARFARSFPSIERFHRLTVADRGRFLIRSEAPALPPNMRLAGKEVAA